MNPLIIKILRHQSIALIILFAGIVLFGCDKPLRFPFRVYPAPEKSADSLPAQAPIIIPKIVTDYDGNVYDGVQIGELIWMKQNLRVTHYADGTPIPNGMEMVPENANWAWYENHELVHNSDSTAYYYANPDADTSEYGLLYNWTAAVRGLRRIAYNVLRQKPAGNQGKTTKSHPTSSLTCWTGNAKRRKKNGRSSAMSSSHTPTQTRTMPPDFQHCPPASSSAALADSGKRRTSGHPPLVTTVTFGTATSTAAVPWFSEHITRRITVSPLDAYAP